MGFSSRVAAAALAAVVLLPLSGCLPTPPSVIPTSAATTAPVFANEEEALAAAIEAYEAYLAVSDEILQNGGANPELIDEVATAEVADVEKEGFREMQDLQWRSEGRTTFDTVTLQRYSSSSAEGRGMVTIYVCSNVSNVNVFDASGASVVSANRPDRTAFEVGFDLVNASPPRLIVSSNSPWSGKYACAD